MNCSQPDSAVHGIFQARILEWVIWRGGGILDTGNSLPAPGIFPQPPSPASRSIGPGDHPYNPPGSQPKAGNSHIPVGGLRPGGEHTGVPIGVHAHACTPVRPEKKIQTEERDTWRPSQSWLWISGAGAALGSVPLRQQTSPT